ALTLGLTLVAVALLEKAEFGHFIFFLGVSALFGAFLDLGVSFQMMMEYSTGTTGERAEIVSRSLSAQLWSYGGGIILALAVSIPLGRFFHVPDGIVALGGLSGALVGLFNFIASMLQVRQRWTARARIVIQQAVTRTVATLVGLAFGTASTAAAGAVIGVGVGLALAARDPELRGVRPTRRSILGLRDATQTWASSRWFTLLVVAASAAEYAPVAFVARVAGAAPLAAFGLAAQLAAGPGLALMSIMTFLMPSGSDPSVSLRHYATLTKRAVVPALALFGIAGIAAPFLIPTVFGNNFRGAVAPFELMLVATAAFVAANPLQILHFRLRDSRSWAVMDLVRVVTLVVGLLVFSGFFSAPIAAGSAVATSAVVSRLVGLASLMGKRDRLRAMGAGSQD
ncbi:MAG: lipopolysaccharide biosynthesis protein, partial [Actinomycetota bacterium]